MSILMFTAYGLRFQDSARLVQHQAVLEVELGDDLVGAMLLDDLLLGRRLVLESGFADVLVMGGSTRDERTGEWEETGGGL